MSKRIRKSSISKIFTVIIVLVIIAAGIGGWLWYRHDHSSKRVVTAGKVVPLPKTDQVQNSINGNKSPTTNSSGSANSGGATDNNGNNVPSTNSSDWITSASGLITVKSPTANTVLKSGDTIGGSAQVSQINYRLNDNKVGVIAQGTLDVVNGNFSGVIHFTPEGTGGRLDIFSTDSEGREYNEVQINVGF